MTAGNCLPAATRLAMAALSTLAEANNRIKEASYREAQCEETNVVER